jgi:hypothetical protein
MELCKSEAVSFVLCLPVCSRNHVTQEQLNGLMRNVVWGSFTQIYQPNQILLKIA